MPNLSDHEKEITIKLTDFLEHYSLGHEKSCKLQDKEAKAIALIDNEENLVHVQFTEFSTGKKLDNPILWRIKEWRQEWHYQQKLKADSELRRKAATKQTANIERVMRCLMRQFRLDEKSSRAAAEKIVIEGGGRDFLQSQHKGEVQYEDVTEEERKILGSMRYL